MYGYIVYSSSDRLKLSEAMIDENALGMIKIQINF